MSQVIIQAEHIGKKFVIGHKSQERYVALRDVLARNISSIWAKTRGLVKGGYWTEGDTEEDFWALKDVSFSINAGDRVGVIGRNGAGKSTLLKILSRITEPTEGRVTIRGRVASLLEVGTGFHPELTGRENIYLNGSILGMSRAEIRAKFDQIVDFAEVERFLDMPVKRYSSGMYVRLAFSIAAHLEPEILIVDEVLAVGDAQFQKKCLGRMEDVSKTDGITVLFVSHNIPMLMSLCNKGIYLKQGQIVSTGSISSCVSDYNAFKDVLQYEYRAAKKENEAFINSITIADSGVFSHEQPVLIRLSVVARRIQSGLHIGIAVFDSWRRKIFTTFFPLADIRDLSDFQLTIPSLLLLGGTYSIDAALFVPNGMVEEYLTQVCSFEVDDFTSPVAKLGSADTGMININCAWE